jgi:protein-tyrosine phosphatase
VTALEWEGCLNVRDLGGLETEDGRRIRAGAIVRADNVRKLTDAGWHALARHGVSRIVDLRWVGELAEDPPRDLDVEVVNVSVLGDTWDDDYGRELDAHLDSVEDMADHYAYSYVDFLERYRGRFGEAFAAIADAPDGAVVVHCMGGKDRTGLVSALLLRLAGVSHEAIGRDYALSGPNLAPERAAWLGSIADDVTRRRQEKLGETPAAGMVRVVERIEADYGDVASYLRAAGLDDAQVERLRERLLGAP